MPAPVDDTAASRRYLRVGHKGAAALAPENSLASLQAALEHGVDLVEFDVVDAPDGTLVLGHSHGEIASDAPSLADALGFLAREAGPSVGLDLDLKGRGFEEEVVRQLHTRGLTCRALVSSFFPSSLRRLRALEPTLATGISYPHDRRGLATRRGLTPFVRAGAATLRAALPLRVSRMVAAAEADSLMLHHSVLSAAAVDRCHRLGVRVFAWTVDDADLLARVLAAGVDGVVSNDPRIFDSDGEPRYHP